MIDSARPGRLLCTGFAWAGGARAALFGAAAAWLLAGCVGDPTAPAIEPSLPPAGTEQALATSRLSGPGDAAIATRTPSPAPPTPTATPTPCAELGGRVLHGSYPGRAVSGEVPLAIYLPPCLADQAGEFPTLYLLHGYPFDEDHWLDLGVAAAADDLILSERRQPFLLVLPRQPEPLFRSSDGGPGSYETELLDGLLPYVELAYPAAADPASRALAGISRGGVWALEIGFRHPETFSAIGALSPALAVNHARPPYDPFHIVESGAALPERLLLLAGDQDWAATDTLRLSGLLDQHSVAHQWLQVPGDHSAATWEAALPPVLEFLTAAWSPPP
jgi:enterochelin esterase-like enzyme